MALPAHQPNERSLSQADIRARIKQARKASEAADLPFQPDDELREWIGRLALWTQEATGNRLAEVADNLKLSERLVLDCVSRVRAGEVGRADLARIRERISTQLEEMAQRAVEKGDLTEARRALMDQSKLYGLTSTGGNAYLFNFGDTKQRESEEVAATAWASQHAPELIEGEVTEGDES